jgi:DNA-binding NarL/FixJ family response regulator
MGVGLDRAEDKDSHMPVKHLSCVLLADSHQALAEGMRGLLETAFATVVMVADETSLIDGAIRLRPDVVVVDLSLAQRGSLNWLRALKESCPELKVIVLSVHDEQSVRKAAMKAGADAFVLKRAVATDLLAAVALVRGEDVDRDGATSATEEGGIA